MTGDPLQVEQEKYHRMGVLPFYDIFVGTLMKD